MRYLIIVLIILKAFNAEASWYCKQVASEWSNDGRTLSTCGIGYGKDENEARLNAFENAKKEFNGVCGKETSCAGRKVNIEPQRSDCSNSDSGFTCRRLFNFHVTNEYMTPEETPIVVAPARPIEQKTEINNFNNNYTIIHQPTKVIKEDGSEYKFKRFVRSVGSVKLYETNYRGHHGIILTNPSDYEIESAIKRASKTGSMNQIYILRN